jgi:serine/threonine protein kinase
MKTFNGFLTENKAKEEALKLGLKYNGFGYWKDPRTGKVTHKSQGESLIPVKKKEEQVEKTPEKDPAAKKELKPGDSTVGKINTSELGTMVGSPPDPGDEAEWLPGPQGDNCITDEMPPDAIPTDSYVGKTNDVNWTAGPHGSNYKTDSFDKLSAKILTPKTDVHQKVVEELTLMIEDRGVDTRIRDLRSKNTKPDDGTRTKEARKHLKPLNTKERNRVIDDLENHINRPTRVVTKQRDSQGNHKVDSFGHLKVKRTLREPDTAGKEKAERFAKRLIGGPASTIKSKLKDEDKVAELNALAKKLSMDPEYDLSDDNLGQSIGSGSFGEVFDSKDGKMVIKRGEIGVDELKTLYKMRDNPNFPTLVSAIFDTPFKHQSSSHNNPKGSKLRNATNYWNPGDYDDMKWDKKFPMAKGTFAMTKANGIPLRDALYGASPELKQKLKQNYWKARAALHRQGISHNDMAARNVFADPDTGEVTILDLGLAKKDPRSALFAALGGLVTNPKDIRQFRDYEMVNDFKYDPDYYDENDPGYKNVERVSQYFVDKGINLDDDDVKDALSGGIRLTDAQIETFSDALGLRGTEEEVEEQIYELINMIYDGLDGVSPKQKELENRMSRAFTQRTKESNTVDIANHIRASKGKPPIVAPKVVPKKNLDYDD